MKSLKAALIFATILAAGAAQAATITSPAFGPLSNEEATLLGADKDGNGVRDDVDAYIQGAYKDETVRKAVTTYAQYLEVRLIEAARNTRLTWQHGDAQLSAYLCASETQFNAAHDRFDNGALEDKVYDTPDRQRLATAWATSARMDDTMAPADACKGLTAVYKPAAAVTKVQRHQ